MALGPDQSYLSDFIYGAIDGTVTTFAVVSGVAGAQLSGALVVVLGLANLVGDGFSMAASNYLGTRAEEQLREVARSSEEKQIREHPEGEREEIRQIFISRGLAGDVLEGAVEAITSDEKRWVDMMLQDELGLALVGPSAVKSAMVTFVAFVIAGMVPLLAFVAPFISPITIEEPFFWSAILTAATFFGVGAAKSMVVEQSWYAAGMETTLVGGAAAGLAYFIGVALKGLVI